ncbi:hypothetical protein ACEPAG_7228 [Sanghuangporus baumii]
MKADNVLIGGDWQPLMCDFGISRMLDSSQSCFVSTTHSGDPRGSTRWMAIELHKPDEGVVPKHSKETDVWAFGMTLYEMMAKELPYTDLGDLQVLLAIMDGILPTLPDAQIGTNLPPLLYSKLRSVCTGCWKKNPKERLKMTQIISSLSSLRAQEPESLDRVTNIGQSSLSLSGKENLTFPPCMFFPKPDEGRIAAPQGPQQFPATTRGLDDVAQVHDLLDEILQLRNDDGRLLTYDELRFKAAQLRRTTEAGRATLENATTRDALLAYREKQRVNQTMALLFSKTLEHMRILESQQGASLSQQPSPANAADAPGAATMSSMGFPNTSQRQSQTWMPQMNSINMPSQPTGGLPANQQMHSELSQNGPAQATRQHSPLRDHPLRQLTPIPRSGPTLQQPQMLQAFLQQQQSSNQLPPPSSAPGVLPGQGKFGQQASALEIQETQHRPNSLSLPPSARERFINLLQEWWKRSGINFDPLMMTIGNRQIDINQLHQLHTEVLQLGGVVNVQRDDLWDVIAAKMGWTVAAISDSGHTQDQIAEQIKVVYERLLQSFEQTYMSAAMKHSLTVQPPLDHQIDRNQPSSGLSQPPLSSQQAVQMIKLASMSAEQLRANGHPENLIQNVERSRPQLEPTWWKMQMQRIQAAQQQQLQEQGELLNGLLPFQNQLQAQASLYNPSSLITQGGLPDANILYCPGLSEGSSQPTEIPGQQGRVRIFPQTLNSPKGKGRARPRPKERKQFKVVQQIHSASPAMSGYSADCSSCTTSPSSAQATSSLAEPSFKRSREYEPIDQGGFALPSGAAASEIPSKRIKTDWENVPDAEPSKRQAEAESIKTRGQAAKFYNDMTQILELSNDTALSPELPDTLAQLVKTVGHGLEVPDAAGSSSVGLPNDGISSPKVADGNDSFFSFFDFTVFQQDSEGADTPELVPTSFTNPSPESRVGLETEHPPVPVTSGSVGHISFIVDSSESEPTTDLFNIGAGSLRLGIWDEFNGGESSYFNSCDMWKWDSIPPFSGDDSCAISMYVDMLHFWVVMRLLHRIRLFSVAVLVSDSQLRALLSL